MIRLPVCAGTAAAPAGPPRKPRWLKVRPPGGDRYVLIKKLVSDGILHTVCAEAHCPNVGECWGGGTATFMLLGDTCTRGCRFCAVRSGDPAGAVDATEPARLAAAVVAMGLTHVVLTMVDRDDLEDGGAAHVAASVAAIKRSRPAVTVEALVGDFRGDLPAVDTVCNAGVEVFAHNIETVERLQPIVRDRRCAYRQSLAVLAQAHAHRLAPCVKSSIMLGLGETDGEIVQTMRDLRSAGVEFLTLGQYLQPSRRHLAVHEYVTPARFDRYRELGEAEGFRTVASGPLVRSSYRAGELYNGSLPEHRQDSIGYA